MMSSHPLPDIFHSLISTSIDEDGVYPHQAIILRTDGNIEMMSLAVDVPIALRTLIREAGRPDTAELIYGFDRWTMPGQGTLFGDCIAGAWFRREMGWTPLVIDYRDEPREVRPMNWKNEWWTAAIARELAQLCAAPIAAAPTEEFAE